MIKQVRFILNRLRERLWVRPLFSCIVSIIVVFIARLADHTWLVDVVPQISTRSIERLLSILSSGMLVISTFAVASMIAAYTSASNTATPRSFSLVISDDVSQNALSVFIGAFIFSLVATITFENSYFDKAGRFVLFTMTLFVYITVILMFLRWVDRIARLGRMGSTIEKIEQATIRAMSGFASAPALGGVPAESGVKKGQAVHPERVGYIQHIDVQALQNVAEQHKALVHVNVLPGTFATPERVLAYLEGVPYPPANQINEEIRGAFVIGHNRIFDHDPRFGLIALSEIAGRALSPGINDPGTAINIIGTFVRLFTLWNKKLEESDHTNVMFDRVYVPQLSIAEMFNDAFNVISRDGAGNIEVAIRLQKGLKSLSEQANIKMTEIAAEVAETAYDRSCQTLDFKADLDALHTACGWHTFDNHSAAE